MRNFGVKVWDDVYLMFICARGYGKIAEDTKDVLRNKKAVIRENSADVNVM